MVIFFSRTSAAICSISRALFTMNGISVTMILRAPSSSSSMSARARITMRPAPGPVGVPNPFAAADVASRREVRPGNELLQRVVGEFRVVDQREQASNHLSQVVRGDVGRHPDRDPGRAVDEQVGRLRRQDRRLLQPAVEVVVVADRFLVDVGQQLDREPLQTGFGVAVGRGRVAVDRPRSSPVRRPADSAARSPAPSAPGRRRPPSPRAGDTSPAPRRRPSRTSCRPARATAPARTWRRGCAGGPASARRARRGARAAR